MTFPRLFVAALVVALSTGAALAGSLRPASPSKAPTYRLQTLAHADPPGTGASADVWGHKNHAYLSSYRAASCPAEGVRAYNLTNPRSPKLVSTFADSQSDPSLVGTSTEKTIVKSVRTPQFSGDLALVGFQACPRFTPTPFGGFGLYDVTNPARPRKLGMLSTPTRGAHELWLQPKGNRVYVYTASPAAELATSPDIDPQTGRGKTPGIADFRIFDVTDPQHPVKVGEWGAWKELGVYPTDGRGISKWNWVHSVITNQAATRAFLSYWDLGTVILDISNPTRPVYLGRTSFREGEEGDAHSAALANGGKILIETRESPRASHPVIYDISNPRSPRRLADFRLPGTTPESGGSFLDGVHDPKVLGKRAYFSWYRRGIVVADISKPAKPRLLARFAPPGSPEVWGVFATSKYVLASDMNSGLWVLNLRVTN